MFVDAFRVPRLHTDKHAEGAVHEAQGEENGKIVDGLDLLLVLNSIVIAENVANDLGISLKSQRQLYAQSGKTDVN